jgi:hypothetical protein
LKDPKKKSKESDFSFLEFSKFVKSKSKCSNYSIKKLTKEQYNVFDCNIEYDVHFFNKKLATLKLDCFSFQILKLGAVRIKEYCLNKNDDVEVIGTCCNNKNNKMYIERDVHDKLMISKL